MFALGKILLQYCISPLWWIRATPEHSKSRKQVSKSSRRSSDQNPRFLPTLDTRSYFRISAVCIARIERQRWTERIQLIWLRGYENFSLCLLNVIVIQTITYLELKNWIWNCSYGHHNWSEEQPTDVPKHVETYTHHLMNAVAELFSPKDPGYRDSLEETDPQYWHSADRIKVHQLENVHAALKRNSLH